MKTKAVLCPVDPPKQTCNIVFEQPLGKLVRELKSYAYAVTAVYEGCKYETQQWRTARQECNKLTEE